MGTQLPKLVDPGRLAARRDSLSGELQAAHISRLATLYDISEPVEAVMNFSPEKFGRAAVSGRLKAVLTAQCQRCLQQMSVTITHEIDLKVVDLDQISGELPPTNDEKSEDIVEYCGKLNIFEVLEDELLLATPIIPRHESHECGLPGDDDLMDGGRTRNDGKMTLAPARKEEAVEQVDGSSTTRPFAGLAKLLSPDE